MEGTNRSGERGDKSLLCDPGSDIRLRGREKKKGRDTINKWDEKKKKEKEKKSEKFPWVGVRTQAYFNHFVEPFNVKNRPLTEGLQAVATAASLGTTTIVVYSNRR